MLVYEYNIAANNIWLSSYKVVPLWTYLIALQVTHHEYEVETSNGRTITKRKKTKSTVMFEVCTWLPWQSLRTWILVKIFYVGDLFFISHQDPRKRKKMNTPKANTPRSVIKVKLKRISIYSFNGYLIINIYLVISLNYFHSLLKIPWRLERLIVGL